MKWKSTEPRIGLPELRSVLLHARLVHSVAVQGCLSQGICNLRLLSFLAHLLELTNSIPSLNLLVSVFLAANLARHCWRAACPNTSFAAAFQSQQTKWRVGRDARDHSAISSVYSRFSSARLIKVSCTFLIFCLFVCFCPHYFVTINLIFLLLFILHLVDLGSEALPTLDSEPLFREFIVVLRV